MKKRLLAIGASVFTALMLLTSCSGLTNPPSANPKYKVIFMTDGEVHSTVLSDGGSVITLPVIPEKTGFVFEGWYYVGAQGGESAFSENSLVGVQLSGNMTVHAKWKCLHTAVGDWITDKEPTCKESGAKHRDCSVCNETVEEQDVEKLNVHTPKAPVTEHYDDSDCTRPISYDEVVYCSVCNAEISRTRIDGDDNGKHTPASAVVENTVSATCIQGGSYDEVVYCSTCGDEISRNHKVTASNGHSPVAFNENLVSPTCTQVGSYDTVVRCSVCKDEISRTHTVLSKLSHTESVWITEKEPTCKEAGSKYKKCTVCGERLQTEGIDVLTTHTYDESCEVIENSVKPTCSSEGSYEVVVYCSVCDTEVSRTKETVQKTEHTPGSWIIDREPTYEQEGLQHKKCTACGETTESESIARLEKTFAGIFYVLDGGTATATLPDTYYYGTSLTLPTTVKKDGYLFVGWYENADLSGNAIAEIPDYATDDYTLYAKWESCRGKLTFELNGGIAQETLPDTYDYGTALILPTALTKPYHQFVGWYVNPELTGAAVSEIPANQSGDLTLYAKWNKTASLLIFELGGGKMSGESIIELPLGSYILPTDVTNGDLEFLGWYLEPDFKTEVTKIFGVEGNDITVYAKWG